MGITYEKVKQFEYALHIHSYKQFSELLKLLDEMMETYLEPLNEIGINWQSQEGKNPLIMLISRIFNDFESSRLPLLNGLPEQAIMAMRDMVESSMLFRLFYNDEKLALHWMKNLKEYSPANVKKRLNELKIDYPEGALYGPLSGLAHANLLSVVSHVTESSLTDDLFIRTYHFGGVNNPTWIRIVLTNLLVLMFTVMWSVLPPAYSTVLKNPEIWCDKILSLGEKVEKMVGGLRIEDAEISGSDRVKRDLVSRKLKIIKIESDLFNKEQIASDKGF